MSKRRELERMQGPRRRVRFTYLAEVWPEASNMDPVEAVLKAPDEAVIAALTKDVEVYAEVIQEERARADRAENRILELERAGRLLGELFGMTSSSDLPTVRTWQGEELEVPDVGDVLADVRRRRYRSRNDPPSSVEDLLRP